MKTCMALFSKGALMLAMMVRTWSTMWNPILAD